MSFSAYHSRKNIGLHTNYIKELESIGILNRKVEFLPDDKELIERKANSSGLTRPELAVLLAYTKIHLKQEILKSQLPEDVFLKQMLETAFPPTIRKKYQHAMTEHRLERDIIATQLSNDIVNQMVCLSRSDGNRLAHRGNHACFYHSLAYFWHRQIPATGIILGL
jgi:glutamate dehydrogenase